MRCARLAAPFVTALCIFDTRRGGSAARRSRRMVSCRAYSSTAPQPASRHNIKPLFDVQVGRDHRARRGRVGAPRRPHVLVVSKNSALQLQLPTPTQTLNKNVPHKILKSPIPLSNSNSSLQLKHPNTQTPKPRTRMFRRGFSISVRATKP